MITLRVPLNRPLTFAEVDGNFTYLDSVKVENGASVGSAGQPVFVNKVGKTLNFRRLVAGANVTLALTSNGEIEISSTGGGGPGVTDGDKGDITVSGSGTVWTINPGAVGLADIANIAANTVLVNNTASAGPPVAMALAANHVLGRGPTGNIVGLPIQDVLVGVGNMTNGTATIVNSMITAGSIGFAIARSTMGSSGGDLRQNTTSAGSMVFTDGGATSGAFNYLIFII